MGSSRNHDFLKCGPVRVKTHKLESYQDKGGNGSKGKGEGKKARARVKPDSAMTAESRGTSE